MATLRRNDVSITLSGREQLEFTHALETAIEDLSKIRDRLRRGEVVELTHDQVNLLIEVTRYGQAWMAVNEVSDLL